jgi:hypothetical protein
MSNPNPPDPSRNHPDKIAQQSNNKVIVLSMKNMVSVYDAKIIFFLDLRTFRLFREIILFSSALVLDNHKLYHIVDSNLMGSFSFS